MQEEEVQRRRKERYRRGESARMREKQGNLRVQVIHLLLLTPINPHSQQRGQLNSKFTKLEQGAQASSKLPLDSLT